MLVHDHAGQLRDCFGDVDVFEMQRKIAVEAAVELPPVRRETSRPLGCLFSGIESGL